MIDKKEIDLDHNLFEFTQLWGESKKFRTSLITPLASLDPNDHPEIKSAIIGEIKIIIQKELISKIIDKGVQNFLDLRGETLRRKMEKINQSLYDLGGGIVISGNRLLSEIQDHASFCVDGRYSNNSSSLIYQGFIKDGIRYPKKKQLIYQNAYETWGSNVIYFLDKARIDLSDIFIEQADLGTPSPKLNISFSLKVEVIEPLILRVFEDNYLNGLEDWIMSQREEKISNILDGK